MLLFLVDGFLFSRYFIFVFDVKGENLDESIRWKVYNIHVRANNYSSIQ